MGWWVSEQGGIEGAQIDANQARDMTTPFFEVCLCVCVLEQFVEGAFGGLVTKKINFV